MNTLARRRQRSLVGLGVVALLGVACHDEVTLGAWAPAGTSTDGLGGGGGSGSGTPTSASTLTGASTSVAMATLTSTSTNGAAGAAGAPGLPACLASAAPGTVGDFNPAGAVLAATETATDWMWPSPVTSIEWDLMVEREIERPTPTAGPTTGYYYAHQFSFLEGITGFLGIQAEGGYNETPEARPTFTKIAVFWLSGPPLAAELGDIETPDARVGEDEVNGVNYMTIHARFAWQACRTYHFRFAPYSVEADGSIWYGAWIEDTDAGVETFLGRMLLPVGSGKLAPLSYSRTLPITFPEVPPACDVPGYASALFGRPIADAGQVVPTGKERFGTPLACASSRFTWFGDQTVIRHELGVRPE